MVFPCVWSPTYIIQKFLFYWKPITDDITQGFPNHVLSVMTNLIYGTKTSYKECIADMNVSIGSFKTGKTFLSITTNDFIPPAPKLLQFAIWY